MGLWRGGSGRRVEKVFSQAGRAAKATLRREEGGEFPCCSCLPSVDGHSLSVTTDTDDHSRGCRNPEGATRHAKALQEKGGMERVGVYRPAKSWVFSKSPGQEE